MSAKTLRLTWIAAAMLAASPAMGLQPLEAFIAAAREQNPDAQRARANLAEQNAQADVSLGRQLPGVSVDYFRSTASAEVDADPDTQADGSRGGGSDAIRALNATDFPASSRSLAMTSRRLSEKPRSRRASTSLSTTATTSAGSRRRIVT
jgi:hypothetical protein